MALPHLVLGKTVKAWGLNGELKVQPYADSIAIAAGSATVYLRRAGGDLVEYGVERIRQAGPAWIVQLQGVQTVEQAERLVDCELLISRSAAPTLPEGTYYHVDLMGLRVVTEEGRELGRIVEILETGANDVYVVHGEDSEWLLPATREVVRRVDLAGGIMLVHLLEGMIEAEAV
ncbi:MAG: 16S rRNA processing protein RimM [candidate division NC10 bacterium]|nr:16S rRNA processing protein RimM [candidate division NC10 bacterium]MDE2322430.1 16S rRNA processing protein RimM [candidate division NC10 bacterium]